MKEGEGGAIGVREPSVGDERDQLERVGWGGGSWALALALDVDVEVSVSLGRCDGRDRR